MKNLLLVRHGHAAEGRDDHERRLTPHGERAAVRAGKNLAEAHCEPELALLSTAVRVTQTWEHIQSQLSTDCRVEAQRSLYLADRDSIHTQLVSIPDSVECALVVAHNPGISQLARWLIAEGPSDPHDLIATATALTAHSIREAYDRFVEAANPLDVLIVSGGGVHNDELMGQLSRLFRPIPVNTTTGFGLDADAKEAVLFAVLAHEWANGVPTSYPKVTGAKRAAILGSLTLP